jgi:hypothetical protein
MMYLDPMRRPWWNRVLSAVMSVWLAFSLTEPATGHSCPVHDAGDARLPGQAPAAGVGHHASSPNRAAPADPGSGPSKRCTCLGHCCSISPVGLAPVRVALTSVGATAFRDDGLPPYEYVAVAAEHVLPFQNGPPAGV